MSNATAILTIINSNSRNAITAVKGETNLDVLTEALHEENSKDRPRSTVIGALEMKIDILKDSGEEVTPVVEPTPEPAPVVDSVPEPTPAPVVDRTASENCAAAFLAALRSGDVDLTATLIAEVRREDGDDSEMAKALITEFSKALATKAKRTPKPAGAASDRVVNKLKETIALCTADENGVITIPRETMDAAGWTAVWFKWSSEWNRGKRGSAKLGSRGVAAEVLGFTAELTDSNTDAATVTLTPIAA